MNAQCRCENSRTTVLEIFALWRKLDFRMSHTACEAGGGMLLLKHSPRLLAFCLLAKISTAAAIDPLRVGGSS